MREWGLQGVKLYTAEWYGESKGWKLNEYWSYRYLEKCEELGVKNIHVHKGPTIWPLNRDAFDVQDVDHAATHFPELNFIVEHMRAAAAGGLLLDRHAGAQRVRRPGGGDAVHPLAPEVLRARSIGELLYWIGEDRITFASDYAIWQPKWLIEKFVDFQIPEDMQSELGTICDDQKAKILGLNAARLYGIEVPPEMQVKGTEETAIGSEPLSVA